MAFQADHVFADFLRRTASAAGPESGVAANFLLQELLSTTRESDFLGTSPGGLPGGWDVASWYQTFNNHYRATAALSSRSAADVAAFGPNNDDNFPMAAWESNQDVLRVESIRGLFACYPGDFGSADELADSLRELVSSRVPGPSGFESNKRARLDLWLAGLNERRDARPTFAGFYGELAPLLVKPDWATQLRNVLGLVHLGGSPKRPLPVVLCRYSLVRAEQASRRAHAENWAARPSVLEAGGTSGPGVAFFPFPVAAASSNPYGFGITLNIAVPGDPDFKAELLHFRIDYQLDDFVMIGSIEDEISDAQLAEARRGHYEMLKPDFAYNADVP
ncbi:MAG: hypothetical protein AB7U23_15345 [Dehalococcoidia bacterium]